MAPYVGLVNWQRPEADARAGQLFPSHSGQFYSVLSPAVESKLQLFDLHSQCSPRQIFNMRTKATLQRPLISGAKAAAK